MKRMNRLKGILERLVVDPRGVEGYTLVEGMLRNNERIVIGNHDRLKKRILQTLHESPLGGYS